MISTMHFMKTVDDIKAMSMKTVDSAEGMTMPLNEIIRLNIDKSLSSIRPNYDELKVIVHVERKGNMITFWGELQD
jgi:hypothetical protein